MASEGTPTASADRLAARGFGDVPCPRDRVVSVRAAEF
jgi:hypothetical protein